MRLRKLLQSTVRVAIITSCAALAGCAGQPMDGSQGSEVMERRLEAFARIVQADIEAKRFPGAVILLSRHGKIVFQRELGVRDPETGSPMSRDSIFRLYSMTKPLVSVGAMILVEEGKLDLAAPISRYLPEMANLSVGVETKDADGTPVLLSVPAKQQITVLDLLRHTSGLTYPGTSSLVAKEYVKAGIWEPIPGAGWAGLASDEDFVRKLAAFPLVHEPGTVWEYGFSTDVLGALIARITGQTLDNFLAERLFRPLGMVDTGFWVNPSNHARLTNAYKVNPDSGVAIKLLDKKSRPAVLGGGGGLVSTATDYARFGQMLLNGGQLDGVRIISRKTVEYMTSDQLNRINGPSYYPGPGYGFGLGFAVRMTKGASPTIGSVGDYHWWGFGGTTFWVDPEERMVAVFMIQGPGHQSRYQRLFRNMVYSAIK